VALEEQLRNFCQEKGIMLVGPNCLGVINPEIQLNASFAPAMPPAGSIAMVSQSGALGAAFLDYAKDQQLGFSKFISLGNKAMVDELAVLQYLEQDPQTAVICLYAEALNQAEAWINYRRHHRSKPLLILKAAKSTAGAVAAASHTGSLASADNLYQAFFRQSGLLRVTDSQELLDLAQFLAWQSAYAGKLERVAILTNAGGPAVLATDQLIAEDLNLAELSAATQEKLQSFLPPAASIKNPVDMLGDASAATYRQALEVLIADANVDACLLLLTPQSMTDSQAVAAEIISIQDKLSKPLALAFIGGAAVSGAISDLRRAGLMVSSFPEQAAKNLGALALVRRLQTATATTDKTVSPGQSAQVKEIIAQARSEGRKTFNEHQAREILLAYGFQLPQVELVTSPAQAAEVISNFPGPVALKIMADDILHKSEVGGISLNVSAEKAAEEFLALLTRVKKHQSNAKIKGVLVEEMYQQGLETILGASKSNLGTSIMFGLGGIYVEVLQDIGFAFLPLQADDLRQMLQKLKISKILAGARGKDVINQDLIIDNILRLGQLMSDFPEIKEIDINPLVLSSVGSKVFDSRIVLE